MSHEFMIQTRYENQPDADQSQGVPPPPVELPWDDDQPLVDLPAPDAIQVTEDVYDLITRRVTRRRYTDAPLSQDELSFLLWCTQGIKPVELQNITKRTVPSAGARHAFETILLVNNVTGLAPGLYRYIASQHKLLPLDAPDDITGQVTRACMGQHQVRSSAVTFLWVAVVYRMTYRYGARGYRYLHLDAGHVCQNLYLAAEAIDGGVCAIAAFDDVALNDVLGLDGEEQFVIYLGTVGKLK
jgi:SagB-type dehydrogenase family enzyme